MIKKLIVSGMIAGAAVTGIAACNAADSSPPDKPGVAQGMGTKDATKDVKLGDLHTPYGVVEIPATVTNHSAKPSDYNIEATVYDASGAQVDTASVYIQRVEPGKTAHAKLLAMNGQQADHYKLTVVDRTASYK